MSASTSKTFKEDEEFLLARQSLSHKKLFELFQAKYRFKSSGALSDALIKTCRRILHKKPDSSIQTWAENFIAATKSDAFTAWFKKHSKQPCDNAVDEAGRKHIQQVVEEVSMSFSSVTSAIGESARSKLPIPSAAGRILRGKRAREEHESVAEQPVRRPCTLSKDEAQPNNIKEADELCVDPESFEFQEYKFRDVDVGSHFLDFQRRSTRLVNRLEEKATMFNLHSFLCMNYVWDMDHNLPALPEDVFADLALQYTCSPVCLTKREAALCWELDQELMRTGTVAGRAPTTPLLDRLVFIYQSISLKLPARYLPFSEMNEDSFAHGVLDVFFSTVFPVGRPMDFNLAWANRPAQGSKYRRGNALKPDATIFKSDLELVFLEVKPPRMEKEQALFLEDYWKLANMCKDAIDMHMASDLAISTMAAIQVFGHEMALYIMALDHGIYHWARVMIVHLPRCRSDRGTVDKCMELMLTLKAYLAKINTDPFLRTPSPTPAKRTNTSNLTPTKRPMFATPKQA
ncbi:unnamed protein product [Mortierella alpina]